MKRDAIRITLLAVIGCVFALSAGPVAAEESWLYAPMVAACAERPAAAGGAESCVGDAASACMSGEADGSTTVGMMMCVLAERDVWDQMLNEEYQRARNFARGLDDSDRDLFPEYAVRADQLLAAQRAWITFRDANCAMEYGVWGAGSMRQTAGAGCQLRMTAERVMDLRAYQDNFR